MKSSRLLFSAFLGLASTAIAEVKITPERHDGDQATPAFKFSSAPRNSDAGTKSLLTLVDGDRDGNGGDLDRLTDGRLPRNSDDPGSNFFFRAGTDGGRILLDLGSTIDVKQISTYSWHGSTRGPQVYRLYASDGSGNGFDAKPKRPTDPATTGYKLLATVDTRPKEGEPGGQYGVTIADSAGNLGKFRYFLFDISQTENRDPFGNTFFSEIDIVDAAADKPEEPAAVAKQILKSADIEGGFRYTVETTETPDLTDWAHKDLMPVVEKWYPKIVEMLPSEGFTAPRTFSINFTNEYKGVAATMGNRVVCAPPWFRQQLKGEAIGAVVHELVHVVQQYGRARRAGGQRPPGWLVEGLCDYIRFYLFEPEKKGAEIRPRNVANARYDGSYRVTANFLNFVITKYDKDLIKELNAAMREGRYTPDFWKTRTGKPVEELAEEWKKSLAPAEAAPAPATPAKPTEPAK